MVHNIVIINDAYLLNNLYSICKINKKFMLIFNIV